MCQRVFCVKNRLHNLSNIETLLCDRTSAGSLAVVGLYAPLPLPAVLHEEDVGRREASLGT